MMGPELCEEKGDGPRPPRGAGRRPGTTVVACPAASVGEQHDLSQRKRFGMGNGDEGLPHVQRIGAPRGTTMEPQLRRAADADDLDVLPQDAARVAGPERLHGRLLHREPAGQVWNRIPAPRTIGNLLLGEYPPQKPIAITGERLRNPWNIRRVEANPDDVHA